jgi:hypothetical protein
MAKSIYGLVCALTLFLVISFIGTPVNGAVSGLPADQKGLLNPDSDHIQNVDGGKTIKVCPRNDDGDYRNLQWAFDNTDAGGTVVFDSGTFFMGDGKDSPRRTVWMRRGLKVKGKKEGNTWQTVIRGGGEVLRPGMGGSFESGPFRITIEGDNHPAVFEDIWFREWAGEVIFIVACPGFEFRRCRISHPENTTLPGKIRYVHALWTSGVKARGNFTAEDCQVELGGYKNQLADDEQFLGVFFSNHDTIRVVNNIITGIDEAIEILGNRYGTSGPGDPAAAKGPSEIIVAGNRIDVTGTPGERWPSSWAILVGGNLNVDTVRIENNHVVKRGKGWGLGISGDKLKVTGNRFRFDLHQGEYPPGAVMIGIGRFHLELGGWDMGTSLNRSIFANNIFEGKVARVGIFFNPGQGKALNTSQENLFDLGDSLAALGAETTIMLSKDIQGNTFKGNLGKVVDNAPKGANKY